MSSHMQNNSHLVNWNSSSQSLELQGQSDQDLKSRLPPSTIFEPPEPTFVPVVSSARLTAIIYLEKKISSIETRLQKVVDGGSQEAARDTRLILEEFKKASGKHGMSAALTPSSEPSARPVHGAEQTKTVATTNMEAMLSASSTITGSNTSLKTSGREDTEEDLQSELIKALRQLDELVESGMRTHRMQQLSFLKPADLRITQIGLHQHIDNVERKWLMFDDVDWGTANKSGLEKQLPSSFPLQPGAGKMNFTYAAMLRPKQAWEKGGLFSYTELKNAFHQHMKYFRNDLHRSPNVFYSFFTAWHSQFVGMILALVAFFVVGIIASTSKFSPAFEDSYYEVVVIWILVSSSLVSVFVKSFGGDTKDAVSAFLAAVALWLVVVQIGQTALLRQQQARMGNSG